jgi:glycosyltransferase involved in cell wall biosynthesis
MPPNAAPLVTIAIPTYNRAGSYLPVALRSALAQRYPRLEILVTDNASTDETPALVRGIGDKRLRYLRHAVNIGPKRNFHYALEKARGDYFLLLHDDDAIDEDFVAVCIAAAEGRVHEGVIRTGVRVIDGRGATIRAAENLVEGGSLAAFYRAWFSGKTCWYLVNTLFNTRQLRAQGGFRSPYGLAEDGFAIAQSARSLRIDVPQVKASFRVHEGENTLANPSEAVLWGREYLALLDRMCEWVAPNDMKKVRREGRRFFARLAYNRSALMPTRFQRARSRYEVLRLFGYRCWPTHQSAPLRFLRRAAGYARRRAQHVFARHDVRRSYSS